MSHALSKVKALNEYINEEKRIEENLQRIMQIQGSISTNVNLVKPFRKIIQEGDLKQVTRGSRLADLHYILFNDLLLLLLPDRSLLNSSIQWKLVEDVNILSVEVQDIPDVKSNFLFYIK